MTFSIPNESQDKKTSVIYDMEKVVSYGINFIKNAQVQMDICVDKYGPPIIMNSTNYLSNYISAKNRGVKIRFLTEITPENIQCCKELKKIVHEFKHLEGLKGSICINDFESLGSTTWKESELVNPIIHSNEPEIVNQQQYIFETFWKKADPFIYKIKEIEEGIIPQVIQTSNSPLDTQKKIIDLLTSADSEILVTMSSANAFHRQVQSGAFHILKEIVERNPGIIIKILTPKDDEIVNLINKLNKANIIIRFIEPLSKVSILVVDRKYSLVAETKDDSKLILTDAIGFVTYSNSEPTVLSYVAIFDIIWKQIEIHQELKTAHENLKIHDKMQKEFINIVAHELRTPLTPIIGLTEYVKEKIQDAYHVELLDRVVKDAKKLSYLNERILDITQFEGKLFKPSKNIFSINQLIKDTVKELEISQIIANKIKFEYHFDVEEYYVLGDKNRIKQVVFNLIDNSINSISEKVDGNGVISIIISKHDKISTSAFANCDSYDQNTIIVSVKDTGIGIDEEILPRLFCKFVTSFFQGAGLGLYISKSIIKAHDGKIWAENNKDKKGAIFSFSLPLFH